MPSRLMRAFAVALPLWAAACTQHNPFYNGQTPPDLSPGARELGVPDLAQTPATRDLAGVDLTAGPDLASVDLTTPIIGCGDLLCAGCCVTGVCHAVGEACGVTTVCGPGGNCQVCGKLSQACCALAACEGSLVCNGGTCTNCGGPGQACCGGATCAGGGCCVGGTCAPSGKSCGAHKLCADGTCADCGADGQSCCANYSCTNSGSCCNTDNHKCVANSILVLGSACGAGVCTNASCNGCGAQGESCCTPSSNTRQLLCSQSGSVCQAQNGGGAAQCVACGVDGEACCGVSTCNDGGCCVAGVCHAKTTSCGAAGGTCVAGSCNGGMCGGLGQACCGGTACTAPDLRCINGVCHPCGGKDERCCVDPGRGINVFCEPPYTQMLDPQNICFCR